MWLLHRLLIGNRLKEVRYALYHDAGVTHGDLYSSNIMWKYCESMSIKIVDCDAGHCVEEGDFLLKYFDSCCPLLKITTSAIL